MDFSSALGKASPEESTVTLYGGPDYTGESCTIPVDSRTYSLAATGLPQIASVKVHHVRGLMDGTTYLRLYTERPTGEHDMRPDTYTDFEKDTPDTGTAAVATHLQAFEAAGLSSMNSITPLGYERPIYDTLP